MKNVNPDQTTLHRQSDRSLLYLHFGIFRVYILYDTVCVSIRQSVINPYTTSALFFGGGGGGDRGWGWGNEKQCRPGQM